MTTKKSVSVNSDFGSYLRRVFALMFGAVGLTAVTVYITLISGLWRSLFTATGMSALYYIILFGGLGFVIWAQAKVFSLQPAKASLMLFIYSVVMGISMTPLIMGSNGVSILVSLVLAAIMFACMSLFGYKTVKDLSFLNIFLFIGMIGLILVGVVSMMWPLGAGFNTLVCLFGVLIFALFAAYDMQTLKRVYAVISDDTQKNQLAVLGALHMYISFVAMFEYILGLTNRN